MPMGWTDSITSGPIATADGNDLRVSWASSSPPGTTFQVYMDRRLARVTTARVARLALPIQPVYIDVVAVDPGSERVDFSAEFPPLPGRRATIEWSGAATCRRPYEDSTSTSRPRRAGRWTMGR